MNRKELKQLIKEELAKSNLKENLNPEVTKSVDRVFEFFSIDPDKQTEFIKKAWYDGYDLGKSTSRATRDQNWKLFAKQHRIDEELYTPNEMGDKAVGDESNGPGY